MKKIYVKQVVLAATLTVGFTSLTPVVQAEEPKTAQTAAEQITQIEQTIKGQIVDITGNQLIVKGVDGKEYIIMLGGYTKELEKESAFEKGMSINVEGKVLTDDELNGFEFFKWGIPKGVTEEELATIEELFNQAKELEQAEQYEEASKAWEQIYKILDKYYIAQWEPQPFEDFLKGFQDIELTDEDITKMEGIYEEWIQLRKDLNWEEAEQKMEKLHQIVNVYYDQLRWNISFEDYMKDHGIKVSSEDHEKLKVLYEAAISFEKEQKYDEAHNSWEQFHKIFQPYYNDMDQVPILSFEEYLNSLGVSVSDEDKQALEPLYNEALESERNGDYEKAEENWKEFYNMLDKYFKEMAPKFVQPSNITIEQSSHF